MAATLGTVAWWAKPNTVHLSTVTAVGATQQQVSWVEAS